MHYTQTGNTRDVINEKTPFRFMNVMGTYLVLCSAHRSRVQGLCLQPRPQVRKEEQSSLVGFSRQLLDSTK